MAIFQATINYQDAAQAFDPYWSNVWNIVAANDTEAINAASNIGTASALLLPTDCNVLSAYVHSDTIINSGRKADLNVAGSRVTTGDRIPGWNVVLMRFQPVNIRQVIKYMRVGMTEDDIAGQVLGAALETKCGDFIDAILAIGTVSDINGGLVVSGSFDQRVRMRQQSWNRRFRPGFKRGWVEVAP